MSYGRRLLSLFLSIVTFEKFSESIYHSKYDSNLLSRAVLLLLLFCVMIVIKKCMNSATSIFRGNRISYS